MFVESYPLKCEGKVFTGSCLDHWRHSTIKLQGSVETPRMESGRWGLWGCWLQGRTGKRLGTRAPLNAGGARRTMALQVQENCRGSTLKKAKVKALSGVRLFATPWTVAHKVLCPWGFPGKSTGVGCHFLRQGIFPTQGLNPGLLHCGQILDRLSYQGSQYHFTLPLADVT